MSNFQISAPKLFSAATGRATLAGAAGGLLSYFVGEQVGVFVDGSVGSGEAGGLVELLLRSASWSGAIGLAIGAVILIYDNS